MNKDFKRTMLKPVHGVFCGTHQIKVIEGSPNKSLTKFYEKKK